MKNPTETIIKYVPTSRFADMSRKTVSFLRRNHEHYMDRLFCTVVLGCASLLRNETWQSEDNGALMRMVVAFLLGLLSAPEINYAEKAVIADLVKREVTVATLFDVVKPTFAEAIPLAIHNPADDACAAQLMVVDCLLCKLTMPGEVLLFVYSNLSALASIPAATFAGAHLSDFELDTLMRGGGGDGGGGGGGGGGGAGGAGGGHNEVTTLAAFITQQVRHSAPRCRSLAYRLLGLLATRVFDRLGDKVVKLLLKKRVNETPENQRIIASVLWNVLYVWTERVGPVLLQPTHVREAHGVPPHLWDLTSDLWNEDVPAMQAVCLLSACRYVAARRGPPATNDHIARDVLISLLARRGVKRAVRNQISTEHFNQRATAAGHRKNSAPTGGSAPTAAFSLPLSALDPHDRHDALLLQRLLAQPVGFGAVSAAALRDMEAEALAHGLQQATAVSLEASAAAGGEMNLTYVQRALEIWVSLVRQLCGSGGHPPAPRLGARGVVSGVVGGARGGGGVGAGGRTAVASEAFELFTDGAAAPPAARAVGEELKALLIAAYAAHAAVDEPDTAMDTR